MIPNLNALWARVLVRELHAGGVRHVCVSPGSRSAPLVFAVQQHPDLEISVHLDERSAAFFALGVAKGTGRPVALVCTSGTAAANYFPGVIEASRSCVPLILLTADRPPELRNAGAAQTIDQIHLYGHHVRSFRDLPLPERDLPMLRTIGAIAAHACASALEPLPGPVHLNVPFREPLAPVPENEEEIAELWETYQRSLRGGAAQLPIQGAMPIAPPSVLDELSERIAAAERGLIVTGPEAVPPTEVEHVLALAKAAGMPILADIASGLRFVEAAGVDLCAHADVFLQAEAMATQAPDLVIRLGSSPTSKVVHAYLARHRPEVVSLQIDIERRDPEALACRIVQGRAGDLCAELAARLQGRVDRGSSWRERLRVAERVARAAVGSDEGPLEAKATRRAVGALPHGSSLFLSSSLPIRWAESYCSAAPAGLRVFVNRGANGIDGIVSTALGVAFGLARPMLLVIGDVAFLHDVGGLFAARYVHRPVVILLLNNNGGGIFSLLPIARFPEICEPFFGTPHDCDLASVARTYGLRQDRATTAEEVANLTASAVTTEEVRIIEIRTEREKIAHEHATLMKRIAAEVSDAVSRIRP